MSCERCDELHQLIEIRSPGELAKAIRVIQANIEDGTLEQTQRADVGASTTPFRSVPDSGPWDDILLYEFACRSCSSRFRLSADTYHGRGGEWRSVDRTTG
jgi:hypothetical protein